jgi:hypothetical protein
VVAVLLSPFGIATGRLQIAAGRRADPHVVPCRRDRQGPDAVDRGRIAKWLSLTIDVPEVAPGSASTEAGFGIADESQVGRVHDVHCSALPAGRSPQPVEVSPSPAGVGPNVGKGPAGFECAGLETVRRGGLVGTIAVVALSGKTLGGGLDELRDELAAADVAETLRFEVPTSKKAPKQVRAAIEAGADVVFAWGGDGIRPL